MTRDNPQSGEPHTLTVNGNARVSALLNLPSGARACYVLAHSAGAGMHHPFMSAVADELAALGGYPSSTIRATRRINTSDAARPRTTAAFTPSSSIAL